MTIDEPIKIVDYTDHWLTDYASEKDRIRGVFKKLEINIEHIGGTAVPGLASKPIIDIMFGVNSFPPQQQTISEIVDLGYVNLGEAGVPGRIYFRRRGSIAFNIHLAQYLGELWNTNLAVRDFLRSHSSACDCYASVKRQAVESGNSMLLEYSEAKKDYVKKLVSRAIQWRTTG
jgi:GrpB-like predicted nucleotidyltransferase (UPF0157 family)